MSDFWIGGIAGGLSTFVSHPFDTIKTRIQSSSKSSKSLWKGVLMAVGGNFAQNAMIFGTYELVNSFTSPQYSGFTTGIVSAFVLHPFEYYKISKQNNTIPQLHYIPKGFVATLLRESIGCGIYFGTYEYLKKNTDSSPLLNGGIAGVGSWLTTYPIDVIKTRIQTNPTLSYTQVIKKSQLWNGISICLIRSFFANAVMFYTYENIKEVL